MTTTSLTGKGSATRDRIIEQARQILVEKGYRNLVMRDVAETCSMKLGNLQYYFPNHDALVLAVIEAEKHQDLAMASKILQSRDDPEQVLRSVVKHLIRRWRGESGIVFSTLYLLVLHNEDCRAIYKEIYANYYRLLEEVIERVSPGHVATEYAARARVLCALLDGVPYQTQVRRRSDFLSRIEAQAMSIARGDARGV